MPNILHFERRSNDWWVLTLLPIVIMLPIILIFYGKTKSGTETFFLILQQLFSYSIVLSCTDLGLKYRAKEKYSPFGVSLLIIIFSSFGLHFVYTAPEQIKGYCTLIKAIFLFLSILLVYLTIFFYNNNPESSDWPSKLTAQKEKSENEAKETFDSPKEESKEKSKIDVKWGEQDAT